MSLEQWSRNGWLRAHEPSRVEIQQLLQVVERQLGDAQVPAVSIDGRFEHAYDAALQLCMIPLHASGFRVQKGQGHHKHSIMSLAQTLGKEWHADADYIERCSRLRGQAVYERGGVVSEQDVADLIQTALRVRAAVVNWLNEHHPEFL